jgi:hypothetical protein
MPEADTQLILQALKTQGDRVEHLASSIDRLIEKIGAPVSNGRTQLVLMITILAACLSPLVFIVKSTTEDMNDHIGIANRALERMIAIDTAQSQKGETLERFQAILWASCMPEGTGAYPVGISTWPRIEP